MQVVSPPFLPYFLSKKKLTFNTPPAHSEGPFVRKSLSTLSNETFYRYSFRSTKAVSEINQAVDNTLSGLQTTSRYLCENHTEFRERIIIDTQYEYFLKYPNSESLRFFFFDFEWLTEEGIDKGSIISACYAGTDGIKHTFTSKDITKEKEIIQWFIRGFLSINPDVVVGYWVKQADLTKLFERCKVHNIDYSILARDKKVQNYYRGDDLIVKIGGRIIYDIYSSVKEDQTIYGLKNKRMKTVARHFKIPVIEEDTTNTKEILEEKLKAYNESDVDITIALFNVYFPNLYVLSELFGCPLNMMISGIGSMTFISNLFLGAALHSRGIVSDGMNRDRHPEIFNRKKEHEDDSNYQAALVAIYKKGRFNKVWKVDFSGMYPAIEQAANICPTTTKIIGYEPYQPRFSFEPYEERIDIGEGIRHLRKYTIFKVPDNQLNKTVIIRVDITEDSFLRTELRKIRDIRNEVKAMKKTCLPEDLPKIEARQYALKVIRIIASGISGSPSFRWSDVAVSILTVGLSRELIRALVVHLNEKYGKRTCGDLWEMGKCQRNPVEGCAGGGEFCPEICKSLEEIAIELDTDGIYLSEDIDVVDAERFIKDYAVRHLGISAPEDIVLEKEVYPGGGYFFAMKNYVLIDDKNELIIHGVGLKANKLPQCFDTARDILIRIMLEGKEDIKIALNRVLDMSQYKISDFIMNSTLSKQSLMEYSTNSMYRRLGGQYEVLGGIYRGGLNVDYLKAKDGFRLFQLIKNIREIDTEYYKEIISRLIRDMRLESELNSRVNESLNKWV